MGKYKDRVDLFDDRGRQIDKNVPVEALSPLHNPAIQQIINYVKQTVAVNLDGIQTALATGAVGGKWCSLRGRSVKADIVANAESVAKALNETIQIKANDDTAVIIRSNGDTNLVRTI